MPMGKRTCCRACNNSGIYSVVIFIYLAGGSLTASLPDSASDNSGSYFQEMSTLLHLPPKNIFDDRPTKLQLYVDLPEDSIARVSIFYKTNIMENMQEIPLIKERGFYTFKFEPKVPGADSVTYFFTVATSYQSMYATPLDKNGNIKPYKKPLIDPIKYFEERLKSMQW